MKSAILPVFHVVLITALIAPTVVAQSNSDNAALMGAIKQVKNVQRHGGGHAKAVEAMNVLNSASASEIPVLLEGLDGANPISANWIRAAIQKAVAGSESLPADSIAAYFKDQSKNPQGRWLAWQIVCDCKSEFRDQTIDGLVTDPSMPLRAIGIAKQMEDAKAMGKDVENMDSEAKDKKLAILKSALENARDVKQISSIAKSMSPLGEEVDLPKHLGLLPTWDLVAGFDNKEESGFDVAYEPEKIAATLELKQYTVGDEVFDWSNATTTEKSGAVDLNKVIGKKKGVIAYAATTFESSSERDAEVRIGTPNAHKIWVNGELVMSNEIYHNSNSIDKFSAPVKLKKGDNKVLVKLCQNEQTQSWAQDWSFQFRFCDSTGKAIR